MEELNSLMNGLDIAKKAINTIMAYIIEQSNEEDNFKNKKKGIIEDDE
jgi:hypothetical protein